MEIFGTRYEFPKDLRRRRTIGYVMVPVLFYLPVLLGLALTRGQGGVGTDFLLVLTLFLSVFVGILLFLVHGQRPWVVVDGLVMEVEGSEFQVDHLAAISLSMKGRPGLEPVHYIVSFEVIEPGASPRTFETHPIPSVKDADSLVRNLRRLFPDVSFFDRTPLGEAVATHDRLNEE